MEPIDPHSASAGPPPPSAHTPTQKPWRSNPNRRQITAAPPAGGPATTPSWAGGCRSRPPDPSPLPACGYLLEAGDLDLDGSVQDEGGAQAEDVPQQTVELDTHHTRDGSSDQPTRVQRVCSVCAACVQRAYSVCAPLKPRRHCLSRHRSRLLLKLKRQLYTFCGS